MSVRRLGWVLLWAGPLSGGLALLVLLASAPFFRHGSGVPPAGDKRAWLAIWSALGLVIIGCTTGLASNLARLARAWRHARRPSRFEWVRATVNLVFDGAFFWLWLRG